MIIELLSHTKDPELLIATAAKLCYAGCTIQELREKQTEDEMAKFINMLMDMGHESPLEHVSFTFGIEGVSRITEQQLTRHRLASYSIQSGRYVNRKNAKFYKPREIKKYKVVSEIYDSSIKDSKSNYDAIVFALMHAYTEEYCRNNKITEYGPSQYNYVLNNHKKDFKALEKKAIENARGVFLNSLETKIIFTMNLRSLLNFLQHRCCNRAQDEIRNLARTVLSMMRKEFPMLFTTAGPKCVSGICPENSMQCDQLKKIIPTMKDVQELISSHWKAGVGIC